jgi:SAM-dependent methyltransferase
MQRCEADFMRTLDSVEGLHILDIGCGHGIQSLQLTAAGARVHGIDISDAYVGSAKAQAALAGISSESCSFEVMDAHRLAFADATLDRVVGRGILHHLDLHTVLAEIHRVLKPGGRALFLEPLGSNPLLKLFRLLTPGARTADERPLLSSDLRLISSQWQCDSTYYGLLSAPLAVITSVVWRPFPENLLLRLADRWEQQLNRLALFQPMNQYVLLNLMRRQRSV